MALTSEDLLQPVKNTVSPDIFLQLAKETTLQSAVSQLVKINNNLKKQAKESKELKKEMDEEASEAMTFYKEISSLLEEIKKSDDKGIKLDDKRMKDLTGHINKVVNKSKVSSVSSMNDSSRKVGVMKNASMEINAKLSKTSVPEIGDELTDAVKKATQALIGTTLSGVLGGTNAYRLLTKGMIEEQYEFASEMNKIAFRSKGITDDSRDMQKSFRATSDAVRETGFDISMLQGQMVKGAKRGLKDSQTIAKTGLGLGKMIGVSEQEAASLSDTFFDWNQKLGLSGNQLGSIAHEIKQVSRYSGLVGDNLANVVKNSEKYLDKMKSAGNLTAQATKNTITLQAESQKLGIDDEISDMMTALSSKDDLFKASGETQTALMQMANFSGEMNNLTNGTIKNSKESLKNMASGGKELFKMYSGGTDIKDVGRMSVTDRANADLKMKAATGKGLGDMILTIQALENAGSTFSDKMNDINKELLITTNSEEKLALERKKQDLYLTESMTNSSMFAEAAKNATSLDDAIFLLQNTMNPDQILSYNKELASIAGTFSNELKDKVLNGDKTAIAEAINLSAADALKKAGGGDYTQRVKTAIKNKDTKKLVSLQEKMSKEQQKLGIKDSTIGDPIERATDQIKIMNENLVGYTGGALMWAAQTAGSTGIMAGLMTLIVAQGIFGAESIRAWGSILLGGFSGLKGILAKSIGDGAVSSVAARMSTASAPIAGAVSPMAAAMSTAAAPAVAAESTALTTATTAAGLSLKTLAKGFFITSAVIGALTGSYWAGQEAANHFNTEIENLTMSQLYASKGAGLLTGALNFLTFGVFNSWLGATGSLTSMLAKFNEKIPVLSLLAAGVDVVFGAIYGVYKLVVNLFSGIFSAIGLALSPFIDMASSIINAISSVLSPFTALNEKVEGMGSLITIVSDLIGGIGTFIGGIAKAIGYLIKIVFTPFAIAGDLIAKVIATFYRIALSPALVIFNGLKDTFFGLIKVIKGIFNFDFSMIFEGLKQTVFGVVKAIAGFFLQIPIRIWTAIKEIGPMLIGAFKAVFIELPKFIISSLMGAFKVVFIELPQYLWNSLFDGLKSLTQNDMFGPIFEPFLEILKPINEGIHAIIAAFSSLMEPFNALLNIFSSNDGTEEGISLLGIFTSGIRMLSTVIGGFIRVALFPLKLLFEGIGATLEFVAGIITAFKDILMKLVEIIKYTVDLIIKPFEYLYDVLVGHSIVPDLVFAVIGCFTGLATNVLSGLFSFAPKVLSLFQGMCSGIVNSASGAMEYIKSTDMFSSIASKFNTATEAVSNFFSPLMKGFNRARESGEGLFSSLKRGALGQYNSMTKGGSKVSTAIEKGKGFASTAIEKGKGFASTAIEKGKGLASTAIEKGKGYAPTAMEKGKGFASTAMEKGKGYASTAMEKGKGFASTAMEKGKGYASTAMEKGKGHASTAMEKGKGFASTAMEKGKGYASTAMEKGKGYASTAMEKGKGFASTAMTKGKGHASTAMEKGKGYASTAMEKGKGYASTAMEKGKGFASTAMTKGKGFASTAMTKGKGLIGMAKAAAPSVAGFAGKLMGKAGSVIGGLVGKVGLKTAGKSILKKLPGIGAIAGAGFAISELIQGNVGGAIKELGSGIVGAIPVIGPALSFAVDMFGDSIIDGAKWLGSTLWEGTKAIGSTLWEGAKAIGSTLWEGAKAIGSTLWEGAKTLGSAWWETQKAIGSTLWEGAKTLGSAWWETQKAIGSTLWEGAKSGWNWLFGNKEKSSPATTTASVAAEKYTNYTPPSQLVTPDNNKTNTASIQPTGNVNIHDKVRRNKAEEDHVSSSRNNVDISELVVLNTEMLHYMMLNQENTAKIVDLLTLNGSLSGESTNQNKGNTKGNSKPRNSPNYNQWQFGRYDQNASLQVVTTGI